MNRLSHINPRLVLLIVLAFALLGMALVTFATTLGPGVGGDATIYITTARNLLAGRGLVWPEADGTTRLLPYTPPFYPLALSAVGALGVDMVAGARWLNVLMFGALVYLCGLYFYRLTGRALLAAIVAGLVAASPVLIGVQVWAMSEGLFLLLGFGGLFLLLDYFDCPRPQTLTGAAVLAGLAFLTRYIGVAFVITGGLALLLFARGDDRRIRLSLRWERLRPALIYGVIAVLPILIWLVIDFALTGTVASRSGQPASAYWQRFTEMGPALEKIVLFWLLPESKAANLPGFLQTALWLVPLAALLVLGGLVAWRLSPRSAAPRHAALAKDAKATSSIRLAFVTGLFVVVYLVVLAGVQVFTYPPVTLASRMLSPVHLAVLVLIFALLHLALRVLFGDARLFAAAVVLVGAALLGTYLLRGAQVANGYHRAGIGYNAPDWSESSTVTAMRVLPADVPLVSNETTAIMYFAGRAAYPLREIYQDRPSETFGPYGSGDDDSQRAFREEGAALVLFYNTLGDDFAFYGERAGERIEALKRGLYVYAESEDGAILFYRKPNFVP